MESEISNLTSPSREQSVDFQIVVQLDLGYLGSFHLLQVCRITRWRFRYGSERTMACFRVDEMDKRRQGRFRHSASVLSFDRLIENWNRKKL